MPQRLGRDEDETLWCGECSCRKTRGTEVGAGVRQVQAVDIGYAGLPTRWGDDDQVLQIYRPRGARLQVIGDLVSPR